MDMNNAAVFARVVEAKGFSAAGRLLGMPKTTVSKRVSDLETQLGVRLLNRTTRSVSVTEAGARVYTHCLAAIAHMDRAEREARALQSEPEGMLNIAAPGAIGVPWVLPAISAYLARYPGVKVTLRSTDYRVDLDREGIDVLIWSGSGPPKGHSVRLVAEVEIGLFASAPYIAAHGNPATPRELADHGVIAFTQALDGHRFVWHLKRGSELADIIPATPPRFLSNDGQAVLAAVASGHGIGALPLRLVSEAAEGQALVPVLPAWRIGSIEIVALFRDGSSSSLKVRLFLDFLTRWFQRLG